MTIRHILFGALAAEKQGCEHSPLLWSAELDRAVADRGFQRAENAKPERF
jgi:hypothetical protein